MKKILVPLADGCEEMEAVIVIDTLRRAKFEVTAAGLKDGPVTASRGVRLLPDTTLDRVRPMDYDALVLPGGGPGVENLMADARVIAAIGELHAAGRWLCAVCAAPLVLQKAGVLEGRRATCYPGAGARLTVTQRRPERVVVDGRLITSQGPGTSVEFALEIVRQLAGPDLARRVAEDMAV